MHHIEAGSQHVVSFLQWQNYTRCTNWYGDWIMAGLFNLRLSNNMTGIPIWFKVNPRYCLTHFSFSACLSVQRNVVQVCSGQQMWLIRGVLEQITCPSQGIYLISQLKPPSSLSNYLFILLFSNSTAHQSSASPRFRAIRNQNDFLRSYSLRFSAAWVQFPSNCHLYFLCLAFKHSMLPWKKHS